MTLTTDTPVPRAQAKQPPRLERVTFRTSRLLEFCSEKELTIQTGHEAPLWPLVVLKELVDNALDACEEAGVAPEIEVVVDANSIRVTDNGLGLPVPTLDGVLDYTARSSSREAYASPTRGAQGNALKTIMAMPYVLSGDEQRGKVEIEVHGFRHIVEFAVNHIRQEPVINRPDPEPCDRTVGTSVMVHWPHSPRSELQNAKERFLQIADDFAWLNPNLTITIAWGNERRTIRATAPSWDKWRPSEPTSPHWYEPAHLQRLIAAYLKADEDAGRQLPRTVREFISEFRGLTGTAKQKAVLDATGLAREPLTRLVGGERVDTAAVAGLLKAMQVQSKPVKPRQLGIIGEPHIRARFEAAGCEMASFAYKRHLAQDGLPCVYEVAFAARSSGNRRFVTGVNWSPGIGNPFRSIGQYGESLDAYLADRRVTAGKPVILFLHVACPRVQYMDRGKSAVKVTS